MLEGRSPRTALWSDGLLRDLKKALAERILDAEMDVHPGACAQQLAGNQRNAYSQDTILTETVTLPLSIPRDLHGRFAPQLIESRRTGVGFRASTRRSSRSTPEV